MNYSHVNFLRLNKYRKILKNIYSGVWFNTPGLAPAQIRQRFLKFGIKPDGIINFLANEPPLK
jgi:hypothetical protein